MIKLLILIILIAMFIYFSAKWKIFVLKIEIGKALGLFLISILLFSLVYHLIYSNNPKSFYFSDFLIEQKEDEKNKQIENDSIKMYNELIKLKSEIGVYKKLKAFFESKDTTFRPSVYSNNVTVEVELDKVSYQIDFYSGLAELPNSNEIGIQIRFSIINGNFETRKVEIPFPKKIQLLRNSAPIEYKKELDKFLLPITSKEYLHPLNTILDSLQVTKENIDLNIIQFGKDDKIEFKYLDFLYFSTMIQTTVGASDIFPNSNAVRLCISFQALISILITVFLINNIMIEKQNPTHNK